MGEALEFLGLICIVNIIQYMDFQDLPSKIFLPSSHSEQKKPLSKRARWNSVWIPPIPLLVSWSSPDTRDPAGPETQESQNHEKARCLSPKKLVLNGQKMPKSINTDQHHHFYWLSRCL